MPGTRLQLEYLAPTALDQIQETAYRLLAEVGIVLQHAAAQEMLHGHGCRIEVENGDERAFIPHETVKWALEHITPHTEFFNRDGSPAFAFGDGQGPEGRIRFHNAGGLPFAYDLESGKRRPATLQDVIDMSRVLDALPHVDAVIPHYGPQDVPPELLAVASTAATLRHTRKPFSAAAIEKPHDVPYVVEMAAACCGGMAAYREHPNMYISISPISPLTFSADVTGAIIAVAQSGTPFNTLPAPSLGATGPITLAGALAQQHAEVLASFVIAAAAQPGAPVVYCSRINPIDLRTAVSSWGGPEIGMAGACATQLAHRLGLPCDTYGLCTSAARLDPQFGYERLANTLTPALAGADIISGVGSTASVMAGGLEIAVIDDELVSLIKHIVAGIEVTPETLALEVMQAVIPRDGVFLGELHTVKQVRQGAIWIPSISERTASPSDDPGSGVVVRARARAREILQTHPVELLPEEVAREIDDILDRARRELVKT